MHLLFNALMGRALESGKLSITRNESGAYLGFQWFGVHLILANLSADEVATLLGPVKPVLTPVK